MVKWQGFVREALGKKLTVCTYVFEVIVGIGKFSQLSVRTILRTRKHYITAKVGDFAEVHSHFPLRPECFLPCSFLAPGLLRCEGPGSAVGRRQRLGMFKGFLGFKPTLAGTFFFPFLSRQPLAGRTPRKGSSQISPEVAAADFFPFWVWCFFGDFPGFPGTGRFTVRPTAAAASRAVRPMRGER